MRLVKSPVIPVIKVEKKLVEVALDTWIFVLKRFVEVALVTREEDAKIFCTKRLRNLFMEDPMENVASRLGTMSLTVEVPVTVRLVMVVVARAEVPMTVRVPELVIFPPTFKLPPVF